LADHEDGTSNVNTINPIGMNSGGVVDFDVSKLEGVEMLSLAERKLCTELQLIPAHYFVLKDRLIAESFHRLNITPQQAKILLKIDINKSNKFLDFCITSGWMSPHQQVLDKSLSSHSTSQSQQGSRGQSQNPIPPPTNHQYYQQQHQQQQNLPTTIPYENQPNENYNSIPMTDDIQQQQQQPNWQTPFPGHSDVYGSSYPTPLPTPFATVSRFSNSDSETDTTAVWNETLSTDSTNLYGTSFPTTADSSNFTPTSSTLNSFAPTDSNFSFSSSSSST